MTSAAYSPYTQYLESIGLLDPGYRTPSQSYRQSLFNPINRLYGLEQQFAPALGMTPGQFPDWLGGKSAAGMSEDPSRIYGGARSILSGLFGLGAAGREERGVSFSPFYPEEGGGAAARQVSLDNQRDLFGLALRPQYGVQGARRFAGRIPQEQQLWEQQMAGGTTTSPWMEWLNTKYNLGLSSTDFQTLPPGRPSPRPPNPPNFPPEPFPYPELRRAL
jgi:hypothetical protein